MSDFASGQNVLTTGAEVTDDMLIGIDTGGAEVASVTAEALAEYTQTEALAAIPPSKLSTQAQAANIFATVQAGSLTGAITPCLTMTGVAAPVTAYFPPAAELAAAAVAAGFPVGTQYQARIVNLLSTTGIMTMGASTGITLSGLATLTGQNSYATFNINIVSLTAVTITRVG